MSAFPQSKLPRSLGYFRLAAKTQIFSSPLTGSEQRLALPAARWMARFQYPILTEANALAIIAFMDSLQGTAGTCTIYNPAQRSPRGTISGTPLVKGAGQTGTSINVDALATSTTGLLLAGDLIGLGNQMVRVTDASVDSDGLGEATINFQPPLRSAPADNSNLAYTDVPVTVHLADDGQGAFAINVVKQYGLTIDFVEAF